MEKFVRSWITASGEAAHDQYAMAFYESVRKSSSGQAYEVPVHSSDDDMINLITQAIFTVTAFHELEGNVVDYINLPSRAGFRVLADHVGTNIDCQSWLLGCLIGASTAIRMPSLMRPFKNFFGAGGAPAWETAIWNDFVGDMETQSKNVYDADAKRDVEFKYFDPARFECSVSV